MTTEREIEANRRNAVASTGSVTRNGKAAVSRNALRHGIFAREAIITAGDGEEDAAAYRQLYAALIADLAPVGQMESLLVESLQLTRAHVGQNQCDSGNGELSKTNPIASRLR